MKTATASHQPPGGTARARLPRRSSFNPISDERHKDAITLSRILGREVALGEVTEESLNEVMKPALREAYLADAESVIVACAGRALKAGLMRLQDHGIYLSHEQLLEVLVSLCWNPNKGAAGKSGIEAYNPLRMTVPGFVSKCVREAISVLVHENQRQARIGGRKCRVSLRTVSLDEMEEGDSSGFADTSDDFRDALDSAEDLAKQARLDAEMAARWPVKVAASTKARASADRRQGDEKDKPHGFSPANLPLSSDHAEGHARPTNSEVPKVDAMPVVRTFSPANLPPVDPAKEQVRDASPEIPSKPASMAGRRPVDGSSVSNEDFAEDLRKRHGAVKQPRPQVSPELLGWMHDLDWVLRTAREPVPKVSRWQKLGSTLSIELPVSFAPTSIDEVREAVRKQCALVSSVRKRPPKDTDAGAGPLRPSRERDPPT